MPRLRFLANAKWRFNVSATVRQWVEENGPFHVTHEGQYSFSVAARTKRHLVVLTDEDEAAAICELLNRGWRTVNNTIAKEESSG